MTKIRITTPLKAVLSLLGAALLATSCGTTKTAGTYEDVSYQPAGNWNNPNAQMVKGNPVQTAVQTPEQKMQELTAYRTELQARIDALATELVGAKKKRAAQITAEMEQLALEVDRVDTELQALSAVCAQREQELASIPVEKTADTIKIVSTHAYENDEVARGNNQVTYSVQVGLLSHPNMKAYNSLGNVKQVKRTDGYAYYYGTYTSKTKADEVARQVRSRAKYRDAFVVALKGDQRIPLSEAKKALGR